MNGDTRWSVLNQAEERTVDQSLSGASSALKLKQLKGTLAVVAFHRRTFLLSLDVTHGYLLLSL